MIFAVELGGDLWEKSSAIRRLEAGSWVGVIDCAFFSFQVFRGSFFKQTKENGFLMNGTGRENLCTILPAIIYALYSINYIGILS